MRRLLAALLLTGGFALSVPAEDTTPPALMFAEKAPADLDEAKLLQKRIRRVIRKTQAATVKVGGGSGVVIDPDGTILTVAHLTRSADRHVTVTFPDGKKVRAKTLGANKDLDASLIKITEEGEWPYVRMGKSKDLVPGQWCLAIGFPFTFEGGKAPHVRVGRIVHNHKEAVMSDCVIMGGDSGGPLFDLDGKVIGISSRCDQSRIRNFHVPIDVYHKDWARLIDGEVWSANGPNGPFLGIGPTDGTEEARLGMVVEGSGAHDAGLEVGDLVLNFAGQEIETYHHMVHVIREHKPGDEVAVTVKRGPDELNFAVTIGKRGER